MMATAMITFCRSGPSTATNPMPIRMAGNAKTVSKRRLMMLSMAPPKYPAISPSGMATTSAALTENRATRRETRAPYRTRDKTSRPRSSVPKGCTDDGGEKGIPAPMARGSNGASTPAKMAAPMRAQRMINPTSPARSRRIRRSVCSQNGRGAGKVAVRDTLEVLTDELLMVVRPVDDNGIARQRPSRIRGLSRAYPTSARMLSSTKMVTKSSMVLCTTR